jgi:hypothetical protein
MMRVAIWIAEVPHTCLLVMIFLLLSFSVAQNLLECRNNLAPTYSPRQADVWSLGIVLINMLYHHNPWSDTSLSPESACQSFVLFRALVLGEKEGRPEDFFKDRFVGMSEAVATFLVKRVFCFLPVGEEARAIRAGQINRRKGVGNRISAEEFGIWAKNLPELFGKSGAGFGERDGILVAPLTAPPKRRVTSIDSCGFSVDEFHFSRRPSLRASGKPSKPNHRVLGLLRDISPSRGRSSHVRSDHLRHLPHRSVDEQDEEDGPPKPDPEIDEHDRYRFDDDDVENVDGQDQEIDLERPSSRATSSTRRRKRGARRKGNSSANVSVNGSTTNINGMVQTSPGPIGLEDGVFGTGDRLDDMAVKSQLLLWELSKKSNSCLGSSSSMTEGATSLAVSLGNNKENIDSSQGIDGHSEKQVTPKKSKWRMFSSSSHNSSVTNSVPPVPTVPNFTASQHQSLFTHPYALAPPICSTEVPASSARSDAGVSIASGGAASVSSSTGHSRGKGSNGGSTTSVATGSVNVAKAASLVMALNPAPRHSSSSNITSTPGLSTIAPSASSSSSLYLPATSSLVHGSSVSLNRGDHQSVRAERSSNARAVTAAMYPSPNAWSPNPRLEQVPLPHKDRDRERRNFSPPTTGSSLNAHWRNSLSAASSSAGSSASAFSRYSNSSVKSFDTFATSHSGSSSNWRSKADHDGTSMKNRKKKGSSTSVNSRGDGSTPKPLPVNVKSSSQLYVNDLEILIRR